MADIESNVRVNIDTTDALSQLKLLQQQISAFQQAMRKAGADNAAAARAMQQNLANSINATGKFQANIQTIQTSAERFTTALEKNKLTMGEYFRYAGGASKSFGKLFKSEFETINQVARERVKDLQTQYIKLGRDANGAMKAISVRPLALDMDNLGTKTQIAAQRQQLFNQLMKQGSTQLLNFGKNTQWAGRQLMVGFTVPLTMMGSAAAKAYMEIEKASISFKRVYGDINTTADETEKMAKSVKALADEFTKYGASVADTMDMAAKAAAMGKTGADLLAQVSQAAKLSVLGQVDQNQALETTISLTNAFGTSADQLSGKIDFLNAVENQTVTSIEDLTIAIPKAAPVIKQLGGNVEDLTFFLTAMKEGGINASEGANALKSGIASMINPTAKASEFLQGFGINMKSIVEGNAGNIKQTVIDVAKAFDTLDPLNRARAIEQMFGKFQFSRISTLFQNVIKEGSQAQTVAGLAKQTAEELSVLSEREMKKISDSPMYKFQKSVQDIQAKLAPVGEAFLKAVTPIMDFVGKVLDGFNGLSEGSKKFITILVTAVAGIGPLLLMSFGLIANGIANVMKLFTNMKGFINKTTKPSDILGEQTGYMTSEQLKGAAIAASLDQAHAKLRQTFTSETQAVNELATAYRNAIQAQQAFSGVPGVPVGNPNAMTPKKYANGVSMVPGPAGAGDIVPALLSPGEAVIPAKSAKKYAPVIAGMVAGNLPGFENGTTGVGMRQSIYGPMTLKQTEGLARTGLQLKDISDEVMAGPYANVPPTDFGTQISPTTGHSFPAFEVGGIYQKPDGTKVFVKPQIDLTGAMAEVRGTQIARDAHGLVAPKQEIRVMMDPTDPEQKRRFLVLESELDDRIANIPKTFTDNEYFTQLVASLLRGDKDLGVGNLGGNVLADVGPAGVFGRASGKRALGSAVNSMEEQAIINLLGVKGGAKRFFAEVTSEQVSKMSPEQYNAAMRAEMQRVMPKLQATIAGFGNMSPEEQAAYQAMQQRLQAGMTVDWGKYQVMHSGVKPKEYKDGTLSAGLPSPKNPMAFAQALQAMTSEQIRDAVRVQDTHLVGALDIKDPKFLAQVQRVYPGATAEELELFEPVSNLTAQLPGNANQVMKGKSGYPGSFFKTVWNGFENKLSKSAAIAGISLPDSQSIENEIGNVIGNYGELINDKTMGDIVGDVLGSKASITDDGMMKRRLWELAERVGGLRSKPKKANSKSDGSGLFAEEESNAQTTDIIRKMLQDGALEWDNTTLRRVLASGAKGPRFGGNNIEYFGSGKPNALVQDKAARRLAQEALKEVQANPNMPMPQLPRAFTLPENWEESGKNKLPEEQQIAELMNAWRSGVLRPLNDTKQRRERNAKLGTLAFTKRDADDLSFNIGKSKNPMDQAYDSSRLKGSPLNWSANQSQVLNAYDAMSKPFGTFSTIIPQTDSSIKLFNDLALKMEKGGIVPGPTGKPKASVFDIDDTLLDLSSFMVAHKAENDKLPEGEKKKWYKEVAKDPKGIPAGLAALKAAQQRGNKILLMTARPDFYEPYTVETLQKLGIDMNGIKLIARKDKDYRKPEQMKYDKTSAFMKYYDIEEFYDDMDKTRGAISLLGIPTYNPLKLAGGAFSVPGPKGAGDVVPAMLSPGEAVIPADKAARNRPLIQQMISGNVPGYNKGIAGIPGYNQGEDNVQPEKQGFFSRLSNTIVDSSRKAGDVLKSKAMDAADTLLAPVAKYLTNGEVTLEDHRGRTRYNADTKETLDKKGNVIAKEVKNVKDEESVLKDKESNTQLTRQQIEEQISLTDKEYEQILRRQEQLKLLTVLSEKERQEQEKNQQFINTREQQWLQERGATEKKESKASGFFTRNQTTGKVQSALYAASGALSAASMVPGQVGQAAQAMLPAVGAATTAMSLIPGPAGMIVAGFAAVGTVVFQINEHLNKLRDESFKLATAMGNGQEAMGKFAEFAKTVSGTEAMNKRRSASAGQFFNVVEGKTTFGESYMKGESGKQLVKDVSQSIKDGGLGQAKTLITNQLSTAITSGVMTPAQARSIAANLGAQLGDMSFGMEVSGKLLDLVGPNGENLKNEPLLVRMKVVQASMEEFEKTASKTTGAKIDANNVGKAGEAAGWGLAAGAVTGVVAAGISTAVTGTAFAATALGATVASGPFAPVVGIIAAAAVATKMIVDYQGEIAKQAGQLQANLGNALSAQQQMVDSLQVDYEKRIAAAKAAGDTAEATRLQNQYLIDQAKLLEVNAANMQSMYKTLDAQSTGFLGIGDMQTALGNTANDAIKKAFEGTGQEVGAQLATDTINAMAGATNNQKTMIKTMVAQKLIGFDQLSIANEVFGSSEEGADQFQRLLEQSPTEANRALGLAGNLQGAQKKQFLVDMSLKNPAETKLMNDALEMAQKTSGVFFGQKKVAEAVMKFSVENPELMLQFKANIDKLKDEKTVDVTVVQRILGPSIAKLLGDKGVAKFFGKYNKENRIVFLTELQQIMAMKGDPDMIASWNLWNKENGQTKSFAEYAAYQADRTVTTFGVDNTGVGAGGQGEKQGPDPSILDPYVKMLREANNWQQKLTIGWNDSYKAIMRYSSAAIKQMGGIAVLMKEQGADAEIVRDFMNGTEEEQNRIIDKKTGKLRKNAGELLKKLKEIKDQSEIGLSYVLATPAERLAKDNELFQAGLDVIATKEKKINEKYDARIKALDEIGKIQEKNNQRQQDSMTLADALSKGDIAAAAKAALQIKQNEQKSALDDAKASLENAKKLELEAIEVRINGLAQRRSDLEALIEKNSGLIAGHKLKEAERQANIARDALVSSTAMAKMLKDGKALSLVKPYNPGTLGGTPAGGTQTGETETGVTPTPGAATVPAKLNTGNAALKYNKATISGGVVNGKTLVGAGVAQNRLAAVEATKNARAAAQAMNALPTKLRSFTSMSELDAARQAGTITDAEYKDTTAKLKEFEKTVKEARRYGVVQKTSKLATQVLSDINAFSAQNEEQRNATVKKSAAFASNREAAFEAFPEDVKAVLKWMKEDRVSLFESEVPSLQSALAKLAPATVKEITDYIITPDAKKKNSPVYKNFIKTGKFSDADVKAYVEAKKKVRATYDQANTYRRNLDTLGYNKSNVGWWLGDGGKALDIVAAPADGTGTVHLEKLTGYASGGFVKPKYFNVGGSAYGLGTDTIPAMLTPGEFVIKKSAVDSIGTDKLNAMNNGTSVGESVYNYSITVNASSSDASGIADAVLREIERLDSRRIRSSNI